MAALTSARHGIGIVAMLTLLGCSRPDPSGPWTSAAPTAVRQTGRFEDGRLVESSGVAVSRTQPGILWSHNDAGHRGVLFATDTSGRALGRWTVAEAGSVDWEDIALGPCPGGTCLYVGDVGDNAESRPYVVLYRFPEPRVEDPARVTPRVAALRVRYPDRPRDVEGLFVDGSGDSWLVSKGRRDGVFLYRVPAEAWEGDTTTAERVAQLPIPHHFPSGRLVTGASISPDGQRVVMRTYHDLYFFERDSTGSLQPAPAPNQCTIMGLEPQGEAVDWWDAETLVLTSEGGGGIRGPIHLIRCPMPIR